MEDELKDITNPNPIEEGGKGNTAPSATDTEKSGENNPALQPSNDGGRDYNKLSEEKRKMQNDYEKRFKEQDDRIKEQDNKINSLIDQIVLSKLNDEARKAGVEDKHVTDLFAIIKGNGKEITAETVAEFSKLHPEWQKQANGTGVRVMGSASPEPENPEENKVKEDIVNNWGNKKF